jgi:hypothetical protein
MPRLHLLMLSLALFGAWLGRFGLDSWPEGH